MTIEIVELALISCWARSDWGAWTSIVTGKPVRPELIGGSVDRGWRDRPAEPSAGILGVDELGHWTADRKSIYGGFHRQIECSWTTVQEWLRGFTAAERQEVANVRRTYQAAYFRRSDEDHQPWSTRDEREAAGWLHAARMRDGAYQHMAACRERYLEILAPHIDLTVPEFALFALEAAS